MKHIVFLTASGPPLALQEKWLAALASGPPAGFEAAAVNVVLPGDAPSPWDVVIEFWTRSGADLSAALVSELHSGASACAIYRITEFVEKDTGLPTGWPTAGLKMIVPWFGRPDVSPAERKRHWDEHVPLANRIHVGVARYVRNWVEAHSPADAPEYQGIATQSFATPADLSDRLFDSPASMQVILDDVAEFIADHVALIVTEYRSPARA